MTEKIKKMAFVFGDTTLTFTENDVEAVFLEWEKKNPGKRAERDMKSGEFADACMKHLQANARPTRTVLHN